MLGYLMVTVLAVTLTSALNWNTFIKAMREQARQQTSTAKPAAKPATKLASVPPTR